MPRTPLRTSAWLVTLAAAVALGSQSVPDLRLSAGQPAQGEIAFDGEEDRVAVDLVAGARLTFTAKSAKKSLLRPTGDLYDAAGAVQTVDAPLRVAKPTSISINNWVVPSTGTYLLGIRGTAAGPTGLYELTTKTKPAPRLPTVSGSIDNGAEVDEIGFDALAGSSVTLTLKSVKGSTVSPRVLAVFAPDSTAVPLDAVKRKSTAKSDSIKALPLPQFGRYRVRVQSTGNSTGGYTLGLALKAPKLVKTKLDFRGASGGETTAGVITSIQIVPAVVTLDVGKTRQLSARATYADGRVRDATRSVTWSARNGGVLRIGNGASCGLATAVAAGGSTIDAWSGAAEARASIALVGGATVAGVTVLPVAPVVAPGDSIVLQASATISTGDPIDVTSAADWSATGGAPVSLVGSRVTAGSTSGVAQVTTTVNGVASAVRDVTITVRRLERIVVSPAYAEISSGGSQAFTATGTYSDGTTATITNSVAWMCDNLAAATTSHPLVSFVGRGTAGIRAAIEGVASRPAVLNCGPVALTSVTVQGATTVPRGAVRTFTADATFEDGGTRDITEAATWSSSTSNATVETTAGHRGRVTGAADSGAASIQASVATGAGVRTGQLAVSAAPPERTSLFVVPRIGTVPLTASAQFRAFFRKSDGSLEDVTAAASWVSSNPATATVVAGTVRGIADGGASIAATLDGRTAHGVAPAGTGRIAGVAIVPPSAPPLGTSRQATATATFFPIRGGDLGAAVGDIASWSSGDPISTPVDAQGVVSMRQLAPTAIVAVVGAVAAPEQTVTASTSPNGMIVSVRIFPQAARSAVGADVQLAAQLTYTTGDVADVAQFAIWNSATPSVATVVAGLVHPVAKGTSSISAAFLVGDTRTFTTLADAPTVASVSPATLARGASGVVVTIDGTNLDGLNPSVSFSGSGVTASAVPTVNGAGTQATVTVNVASNAALGTRDLTFTTLSGAATKTAALTIASVTPTIASISPTNIDVPSSGSTGTTLSVNGSGFSAGDTFSLTSSTGVTLSNVQVASPTTMTGLVTVSSTATQARLDVTVTQSAGAGGQTATLTSALKIGPPDPTVSALTPAFFLADGRTVSGQITGTNFNSGITVNFPGASGNFTFSASRQSATLLTFQATVAGNATPALYDLTLQNSGDISRTFAGLFVLAPRDPTVASFGAASLSRGVSGVAVEVVGTNFRSGDTVSASGGGVTFSSVSIVSAERITATVAVAANATISQRDLTVSHATSVGGRGATLPNAFRVTGATPTVTACNPSRIGRTGSGGPTRRTPVAVTGTNFCTGATVAVSRSGGSGVSVASSAAIVLSDTLLAFEVDVTGTATVGQWDVTVTNPGSLGNSGTSGNAKLDVVAETTLCVNRVAPPTGAAQGGNQVTVYGAGFVRGCQVDFGTERAPGTQFIDQNTLVCVVPPPANPTGGGATSHSRTATTFVDVRVTINPGQGNAANATLTGGYGYVANSTVFKILQSFPADSSTGVPANLRSAVVRLSDHAKTDTAVFGSTQGTNCQWYEAGGVGRPTGMTGGFGADRRFLVFSRTGTGNLGGIALPPNTGRYTLETPTAVKSAAGTALTPAKLAQTLTFDQWVFTISPTTTDTTAPTLASATPAANASGVSTNATISQTFSEEIDPLTVTASSVTLTITQGGTSVPCAVALSNDIRTVTLTPYLELAANTNYTVTVAVSDLFGNALSSSTRTFTTTSGSDAANPTIDAAVFEDIPSDMDGSGTYVAGTDTPASTSNSALAYDLYLPRYGWRIAVNFSDTGGAGIDETTFSARCSVASGSTSANAELASKFTVTSNRAEWTIASADALSAGDDVTLTLLVRDKSGNTSASKVVTFDVIDIDATAQGSGGGDLDPFDTRETWVLRFDGDRYTATLATTGTPPTATQQVTTTGASNGVADIEESLRISGLATANMSTDAANTVNGPSVGTNAIVVRIVEERIRATLRARYGIAEDGTRGPDSMNIEFLLPGEQGSLSALPTWSTSSTGNSSRTFSEMDIGGDTAPNSSPTGTSTTIGLSYIDPRNRNREADMNDPSNSNLNNGIFGINMAKSVMNSSLTGTTWGARVLKFFQAAKGGIPVGEDALDDDVLAGAYDRTSSASSNTQQMKDRYDRIMDALENAALSTSSVIAHEIGHALGLVPDGGPKTGFFGNAPRANTFTEAIAVFPNTPAHLNCLGNDIMSPVSSVDQRSATGSDFMRFSVYDRGYLLHRQVFDEGR